MLVHDVKGEILVQNVDVTVAERFHAVPAGAERRCHVHPHLQRKNESKKQKALSLGFVHQDGFTLAECHVTRFSCA